MSVNTAYKLSGYLSLAIGFVSACSLFRLQWIYYGIYLSLVGFVVCAWNILLYFKYYSSPQSIPKGLTGIFLNLLPSLFMYFVIWKMRKH
jgi:hypothetical protein